MSHNSFYNLCCANQQLFDGSCALREIRQGFQQHFAVNLNQDSTYMFKRATGSRWLLMELLVAGS